MINTSYNSDTQIITTYYEGNISLNEVLNYINNFSFPSLEEIDVLLLEDFNKANLEFKPSEIGIILSCLQKKAERVSMLRIAFLSLFPKETAYCLIANRLLKAKGLYSKVFCTTEAATNWLQSSNLVRH